MYNNKKILAVITARGGSKRLANKNILDLDGKPLIVWSIDEANKSKYIDKIIVTTDSKEISEISKVAGAEVPFLRPSLLASDNADTFSVLKHSIEFYKGLNDYVILLQPTSPLRTVFHIDSAIELLNEKTKAVVSVSEVDHSPLWSNTLPENMSMKDFIRKSVKNIRSQDLPKYYRLNGAVYISEINYFYLEEGFLGPRSKAFLMSQLSSIDIDTELDFNMCEFIINKKNKNF